MPTAPAVLPAAPLAPGLLASALPARPLQRLRLPPYCSEAPLSEAPRIGALLELPETRLGDPHQVRPHP